MVVEIKDNDLYFVGGVVRDEILGTPSFDTDFCYEGNAIEFSKKFNVIKTNPDFGTVRITYEGKEIDIASTRTETYPLSGHLPVVSNIGCALKEDLSRRDFSINAMAKNTVTNEIIDFFNGQDDIKNKLIRVLHNKSFIDDPSRILRALKFSIRFNFELEKETKKLQDEYLANINYDMSYHRLKKELKETFNLNKEEALEKFINQNIYKLLGKNQTLPKINTSIKDLVDKYKPDCIWLVYIGMFNLDNFELTNEEKNILTSYEKIKNKIPNTDIDIYNLFIEVPLEATLLYAITVNKDIAIKYLDNLSKTKISLTGNVLLELGIQQGKIYREIFNYVLEKKLQEPDTSSEDEINWVKEKFL